MKINNLSLEANVVWILLGSSQGEGKNGFENYIDFEYPDSLFHKIYNSLKQSGFQNLTPQDKHVILKICEAVLGSFRGHNFEDYIGFDKAGVEEVYDKLKELWNGQTQKPE